jgi:hypothetical protein
VIPAPQRQSSARWTWRVLGGARSTFSVPWQPRFHSVPTFTQVSSAVSGWICVRFVESITVRLTADRLILVLFRVINTVGYCAAPSAFVSVTAFCYVWFDTCDSDAKGRKRRSGF